MSQNCFCKHERTIETIRGHSVPCNLVPYWGYAYDIIQLLCNPYTMQCVHNTKPQTGVKVFPIYPYIWPNHNKGLRPIKGIAIQWQIHKTVTDSMERIVVDSTWIPEKYSMEFPYRMNMENYTKMAGLSAKRIPYGIHGIHMEFP